MAEIIVGMADCRFGSAAGEILATYALGSCIGLAVYDASASVGGLLHFMLPDSKIDPGKARANPYVFADTGIEALLEQICERGGSKRRLMAYAAGGAQFLDSTGVFEIGKRNYLAMRRILWRSGVLLRGEAVGGDQSRTVRLDISSGALWLQEGGLQRNLKPPSREKGGNVWHTGS
jgi:chemotaxis protein CheD